MDDLEERREKCQRIAQEESNAVTSDNDSVDNNRGGLSDKSVNISENGGNEESDNGNEHGDSEESNDVKEDDGIKERGNSKKEASCDDELEDMWCTWKNLLNNIKSSIPLRPLG